MSSYWNEFRTGWRALAAAAIGLGTGNAITQYTTSTLAPYMLKDFGWERSAFALITTLSLSVIIFILIAGRLADVIGVRRTALIGSVSLPLCCIAFTRMTGPIEQYYVIYLVQALLCVTTTTTVYSRLIVERFKEARGLALGIITSAPALTGIFGTPLLNNYVITNGWRQGMLAVGLFSAIGSAIALIIIPSSPASVAKPTRRRAGQDYGAIFRNPAFWTMAAALLLCNLPQSVAVAQLSLLLMDNGVTAAGLSSLIFVLPIGTITGRFMCGAALDRFPPHIVACLAMAVPSIGLFMIASPVDTQIVLTVAVFLVGLVFGAEGDLVAYLVSRIFGVSVYSSVMGLMTSIIATSAAAGAILLSQTLKVTNSYAVYILVSGIGLLIGSTLFLLLGKRLRQPDDVVPDVDFDGRVSPA